MGLTPWETRRRAAVADNLQQVVNMCTMKSAKGDHPSLRTTLWSLCGNALWRIIASQFWNYAVISRRFVAHYWIKCHGAPIFQKIVPQMGAKPTDTSTENKAKNWQFYNEFWTGSSQVMKRGLHTFTQTPSTVNALASQLMSLQDEIQTDFVGAESDVYCFLGQKVHSPRRLPDQSWDG